MKYRIHDSRRQLKFQGINLKIKNLGLYFYVNNLNF